jgi:hypothetical protein
MSFKKYPVILKIIRIISIFSGIKLVKKAMFIVYNKKETKMRLKAGYIIVLFIFTFFTGGYSQTHVDAGISIGPEGLRGFYLSIGEYYRVPEREVIVIRERRVPDDELPVVFFIADRARVEPRVIVDLRLGGMSWYDISIRYGIYPDVYYIPVAVTPGPPYGKAYGYYKKRKKSEWKKIRLSDADIINLVNLRFISNHYGYSPDKVIRMRSEGKNFIVINDDIKKSKKGNSKGKGKGKK